MKTTLILNKQRIQTLSDLRENFNSAEFLAYLKSGRVLKWLNELNESVLAEKISSVNLDKKDAIKEIMEMLSVSEDACSIPKALANVEEKSHELEKNSVSTVYANELEKSADLTNFDGIKLGKNSLKMDRLEAGTAILGCEGKRHEVIFPNAFYISSNIISKHQFQSVMGNGSRFDREFSFVCRSENAMGFVRHISWEMAVLFCAKLNARKFEWDIPESWDFSLPSEDQWEYFAQKRTGQLEPFRDEDVPQIGDIEWTQTPFDNQEDLRIGRSFHSGSYDAKRYELSVKASTLTSFHATAFRIVLHKQGN